MKKSQYFIVFICFFVLFSVHPIAAAAADSDNSTVNEWFQKKDEKTADKSEQKEEKTTHTADETEGAAAPSVSAFDFVKMIFALLFVIVLIYGLVKLMNKRNRLLKPFQYVENIGGTSVGQNRSIQLIKVGKSVLVVGVGETIQLLKEIEDETEIEVILSQHEEAMSSKIEWQKFVKPLKGSEHQPQQKLPSFSKALKEQLEELKQNRSEGKKKGPRHHE
ncbi:flagella biosynthesis regulatory protein FliZ [Bacillus spizizenii]|uniref:flagella biosynthesis regulatory protein FliZ n=1 Tax=Bacillus spizizenii TaxID=96241 RepID=UPI0022827265|nr:flagella biosynthesis regulatory protein FliZ [Bacillus spizizenii]MCY7795642.1 flagella biosynthesis regulatory protein FliZ [Bacillus spizizenii]MCY7804968.1 flagella biosynthesis regulatory protein FliZ [Bacillus spizizenii]MCY7898912.1 flagella biosynthesis regulatory protein FliZ [Bacillus spizizenii]MCY8211921.1 flagella biosynthesis regulatory protein FliZ [Bacillus spizizenii]MEC3798751.1 flagella biosynthesis regulatory protein FliZ [Bacillus spizizenii]